jgi:hypothetical protein
MSTPTDDNLRVLVSEVRQLNGNVSANARQMRALEESNDKLKESNARLVTSRRRHRIALILVALSLAVDLVLTILVIHLLREQNGINDRQACVNRRSQSFFAAEHDKVAGQVAGLQELRSADGDRAKALEGFNRFITASQHYLDTIGSIKDRCQ